ncbi:MAG TPA: hypothetical protein VJH20_04685 [Candidatus Nanoarchaeia archaeon]|nr:hypothetical protein [Candidatus Nanoarchaeia archaeon]
MNPAFFIPGFAAGLILGEKETEVEVRLYPTANRYAIFFIKTESEALERLTKVYSSLGLRKPLRFDTHGCLVLEDKQTDKKGKLTLEEIAIGTIKLAFFPPEQLLQVEMFNSYMVPYPAEIMIARYLVKENGKETK